MKRFVVLAAVLFFTFFVAPHIKGLRYTTPMQAVSSVQDVQTVAAGDPMEELLKKLMEDDDDEPAIKVPSIKRPRLAAGEHFVPLLRYTDTEVSKASITKMSALIAQANAAGAEAIVLEIATPGGSVTDGIELGRAIEMSHAPIHCVVDGEAASMGFYVLQSCKTRMMTKRSALMVHEPSITGQTSGPQTKWHNVQSALHATAELMLEHEAKRMKISKDCLRSHIENGQDWWMLYGEALEVGAVDGVVASVESTQASYQHTFRHPLYVN
jgi:ATP-dependent protease ClpP protease subunit